LDGWRLGGIIPVANQGRIHLAKDHSIIQAIEDFGNSYYGAAAPKLKGKVLTVRFEIEGQQLLALNAGP
jgi:predicted 3-demethylubiquinone-9 3-methyltransferase (glyoxalase superfamily)